MRFAQCCSCQYFLHFKYNVVYWFNHALNILAAISLILTQPVVHAETFHLFYDISWVSAMSGLLISLCSQHYVFDYYIQS